MRTFWKLKKQPPFPQGIPVDGVLDKPISAGYMNRLSGYLSSLTSSCVWGHQTLSFIESSFLLFLPFDAFPLCPSCWEIFPMKTHFLQTTVNALHVSNCLRKQWLHPALIHCTKLHVKVGPAAFPRAARQLSSVDSNILFDCEFLIWLLCININQKRTG